MDRGRIAADLASTVETAAESASGLPVVLGISTPTEIWDAAAGNQWVGVDAATAEKLAKEQGYPHPEHVEKLFNVRMRRAVAIEDFEPENRSFEFLLLLHLFVLKEHDKLDEAPLHLLAYPYFGQLETDPTVAPSAATEDDGSEGGGAAADSAAAAAATAAAAVEASGFERGPSVHPMLPVDHALLAYQQKSKARSELAAAARQAATTVFDPRKTPMDTFRKEKKKGEVDGPVKSIDPRSNR